MSETPESQRLKQLADKVRSMRDLQRAASQLPKSTSEKLRLEFNNSALKLELEVDGFIRQLKYEKLI